MSAAYIQVRFRLDLFHGVEQCDEGSYCSQYRLPKKIADKRADDKRCNWWVKLKTIIRAVAILK